MSGKTPNGPLVQVTGGTMNIQGMAVGSHASATITNATQGLADSGKDEVNAKLNAVLEALKAQGAALPDQAMAEELLKRVAAEAARDKPDKLTLKSFLGNLAEEVKSVSGIASTVASLAGVIGTLFV